MNYRASAPFLRHLGAAIGWCCVPAAADAAIACTLSATSIADNYTSSANSDNMGTIMLNCTRSPTDATSTGYRLKATAGLYASGSQRRLRHITASSNYINYVLYRDSARTQQWGTSNGQSISGTLAFGTSTSASVAWPFASRIPSGQTSAILGTYTDVVTAEAFVPQNAASPMATTPFQMSATLVGSCSVSSSPGNLVFNYTSFSPMPVNVSTSFGINCVAGTPYTLALNATSGTLRALAYTLALGINSGTGNGLQQMIPITGAMSAGQSGECTSGSCSSTATHSVTVTY